MAKNKISKKQRKGNNKRNKKGNSERLILSSVRSDMFIERNKRIISSGVHLFYQHFVPTGLRKCCFI